MKEKLQRKLKDIFRTEEKFYPLLEDFVFKQVFGSSKNTANLALLLEPLLPLNGEELNTLQIQNTFVERSWSGDKLIILDIKAVTGSGKVINVELQVEKGRVFTNRLVYYLTKLAGEQLHGGNNYDLIRPVYCAAICNFIMLPELPGYVHRFSLREEESGMLLTDLLNIVTIELKKLPELDDGSRAWPVLQCFRCKTAKEAEMHAIAYPQVKEIVAELRRFSLVKEVRAAYNLYHKARCDRKMWEDEYHSRGIEEGAAREREKWEAVRSENEAVLSENEALRREVERLRRMAGEVSAGDGGSR
jgi:predicted transposase/invertase (TIGR01784 family)